MLRPLASSPSMCFARGRRRAGQSGYVLVPVVMGILLLSLAALILNNESGINAASVRGLDDATTAELLARSGLERALWRATHDACSGDLTIPTTALGEGSYAVASTGGTTSTRYTLSADRDAWIRSDDTTRNNGSSAWNHVRFELGNTELALTHFDLSSLPANAQIQSATAWFYIKFDKPHPAGPITVHRITADWSELSVTWDSFAGAFSSDRLATIPAQDAGAVWIGINLTAPVQAWVNGLPNHGILFRSTAEGTHTEYTGRAEGSNPPRLEVVAGPGPTSPLDLSATGTLSNGVTRTLTRSGTPTLQPSDVLVLRPGPDDGKDSYTWEFRKSTNYGSADETWVATGNNNEAFALFEFPIGQIPAQARVLDATLSVHHRNGNDSDVPVTAHRITQPWVESEVSWNKRDNGSNWSSPGGDFDETVLDTTLVGPASDMRYEWDLTELVQAWVNGELPNHGVLLRTEASGIFGERFETSDHADPTRRPSLSIRFACECGQPCMAPQASGNVVMVIGSRAESLSAGDTAIRDMIESWGYQVSLLEHDDSQGNYQLAVDAADLVFVSESVDPGLVGDKLTSFSKGVVYAESELSDELGLASNAARPTGDALVVTDNSHYITAPFRLTSTPFKTAATELAALAGSVASGAQILAEVSGAGSLVALDQGATTVTGGASPGRRVLVPTGDSDIGWSLLTNSGRLLVQRAFSWAISGGGTPLPKLLMVVRNVSSLTSQEAAKKSLIESWGYSVFVINHWDDQATFDAALADKVVVFVTEDVDSNTLGTKLVDASIGVVNEEAFLVDEFGFSNTISWGSGTALNIGDNAHYITNPFPLGVLTVLSRSESLAAIDAADQAPDLQVLGGISEGPALVTVDAGASLINGRIAAGRRVQLPWGGDAMDVASLNADGLTIFERALAWGAGANLPPAQPVAHWKLDETGGPTAADSVGGHDGTLSGSPSWSTGQVDGGLDLDGSSEFVVVPHDDALSLLDAMTFSAWINAASFGSAYQTILAKDAGGADSNYWFGTWRRELAFGFYSGSFREVLTTGALLPTNTWTHVAARFDDATNEVRLYIDGVEVERGLIAQSPTAVAADLTLGRSPNGEYWPGMLDDVRIYDALLEESAIAGLAGAGGGGGGGGPVIPPSDPTCNGSYRDAFNARVFSGSDGSLDWSASPWAEVGESDGPTGGDVVVMNDESNYQLRIQDNENGGEGVERLIDLSGAGSATLSLQYRRSGLDSASDYVALLISTNGLSGPWDELGRFSTDNDASYQTFSIDLSPYLSANTAIRLQSSPDMGNADIVYFDDIEISCAP